MTAIEPPAGLFDRIFLAIKREQELRNTKRLALGFLALLVISLSAIPFSVNLLIEQVSSSGIIYFLSTALNNLGDSLMVWQDFALAIAESLPVMGIAAFAINMVLAIFTLRLFLYKKRMLVGYLLREV